MKKNMGSIDRAARGVVAVALVVLAVLVGFGGTGATVVSVIALFLAVVLGATALVGTCPLYTVLHRDTLKKSFTH